MTKLDIVHSVSVSRVTRGWQGSAKKPDCGSLKVPGLSRNLLSYRRATLKRAEERALVEVEKEVQLVWDHRSTPEAKDQGILSRFCVLIAG